MMMGQFQSAADRLRVQRQLWRVGNTAAGAQVKQMTDYVRQTNRQDIVAAIFNEETHTADLMRCAMSGC